MEMVTLFLMMLGRSASMVRMPSPACPTVMCISRFWMSSAAFTKMPYFCMAGTMTESIRLTML